MPSCVSLAHGKRERRRQRANPTTNDGAMQRLALGPEHFPLIMCITQPQFTSGNDPKMTTFTGVQPHPPQGRDRSSARTNDHENAASSERKERSGGVNTAGYHLLYTEAMCCGAGEVTKLRPPSRHEGERKARPWRYHLTLSNRLCMNGATCPI